MGDYLVELLGVRVRGWGTHLKVSPPKDMRTNMSGCAYMLMLVCDYSGENSRWTGGMAAAKCEDHQWQTRTAPVHLRELTACEYVCVCACYLLISLLVYSHLTRSMQTTPPLHFPPIFSQSGWLNIWTAQVRELPWWRLMFTKYLSSLGTKDSNLGGTRNF